MSNPLKEEYRKAFFKTVKYESSEMDYSELNEIFEELWSECCNNIAF